MNPPTDPDLTPTTNNSIERSHHRILSGIIETVRQKGQSGPHNEADFHPWWPPATSTPDAPGLLPNNASLEVSLAMWATQNNLRMIGNFSKQYTFYAQ